MKILLTAVNAKYIHSNLAVYSLKSYAAFRGSQVEMQEYTINQRMEDIMADIYRRKPDVLCFSCYIWNISLIQELVCELHKVLPNTEIWLGGPEVSYDAFSVLEKCAGVRGVMRGEGEETFWKLICHYEKGNPPLAEIEGITFREEGRIWENPMGPPLDLSDIPFPYEDLKDFEHRIIYYETSRGCPFSCSYCLSSVDKKLRFRSLELVKKELDFFLERKAAQVKFVDRTFNCRKEHARTIWKYLADRDNGVTNFHFEIAADLLEEEDFAILKGMRPGLVQLEIGVQTTNRITLEEIRRKMDFSRVKKAAERIKDGNNIHQHLDLIAGLPFEDFESFARSFNEVCELHPHQLQFGFLKVLKGSWMWENADAYGLVYRSKEPYEVLFTNWISYGELQRLKQVEEMVEIYYNSGQFMYTMGKLERKFPTYFACYEALGDFYARTGKNKVSHSRGERYEIILEFVKENFPGEEELFAEMLTLDYYLRENAKSRPAWAKEIKMDNAGKREMYRQLKADMRLAHYREYDQKQFQRMTHLEIFQNDVLDAGEKRGYAVLFDYLYRDPITGSARCLIVRREEKGNEVIYCIRSGDNGFSAKDRQNIGDRSAEN
ncbi:MAG: B12-binding domain-containing radical SAM protein [Ruminococcus sp.]